ncbi:MAG TPA: hypothetical protein VFO27_14585 [Bryobacteraceae bacterium]|nr:hypothetical protein [Bryobacteraceae bacterium]
MNQKKGVQKRTISAAGRKALRAGALKSAEARRAKKLEAIGTGTGNGMTKPVTLNRSNDLQEQLQQTDRQIAAIDTELAGINPLQARRRVLESTRAAIVREIEALQTNTGEQQTEQYRSAAVEAPKVMHGGGGA